MAAPLVFPCQQCGYGYTDPPGHTPGDAQCKSIKEQSSNPCAKCGHGKYWHDDGFCVAAIAGHGVTLPSFCGMHEYIAA